jgi:LmbE family N-acetylglucosaminyl deacetylase
MGNRVFSERSLLIFGAHPDDAVLGAGAFIAQCVRDGIRVRIITLSSGELAGIPVDREAEDRSAAKILGAEIAFSRLADSAITRPDVIRIIAAELARTRDPLMVLAHDPDDEHQDHVTVGRAAAVACRGVANLLFYEGPSSDRFHAQCTTKCDDSWQQKMAAIACYESQPIRKLIEWADATGRYRAWPRHVGSRCEAFRMHHADLASLSDRFDNKSVQTVSDEFSTTRTR